RLPSGIELRGNRAMCGLCSGVCCPTELMGGLSDASSLQIRDEYNLLTSVCLAQYGTHVLKGLISNHRDNRGVDRIIHDSLPCFVITMILRGER
ncbi:MAG: hypothetical protein M3Y76_08675, partial [Chloroflexota bacterium]|nr:hypothetical protein [Chloroflexota bacterium]